MNTSVRIAGIVGESIVDGPGIRFVVFTQGCPHHCKGCHNPQTHDFSAGMTVSVDTLFDKIKKDPLLSGVTFSGGEPFCQPESLSELAKRVKDCGKSVLIYTGYTFEELLELVAAHPAVLTLLRLCDVLIDGKYEEQNKNLLLKFRGSSNQRILDVPASLSQGHPVAIDL